MTRDPLDDLGLRDRGLVELFNHLTGEPSADELAGEYAALTMFRAASGSGWYSPQDSAARSASATAVIGAGAGRAHAAPGHAARGRSAGRRRVSRTRVGGRLVAAATAVALVGGFAAAGYAEVLPSSLQHLAHQILGFAGVPNSPGSSSSAKPTVPVTSRRSTPGGSSWSQPRPSGTSSVSTSPSPHRSSAAPPSPTASAPAITVTEVRRSHGRSELLVVSIPLARRGDVVRLEELVGGQWQLVLKHRLHQDNQTEFTVVARKISVTYRIVLPATVEHGQSVSGQVTVAARPQKGRAKRG